MSRQPTPANILADVLTADVATPDRTALRNRLRWDYSQVAPVDRKAVEDAAVDILANGQRMQQSVIAIGERLIAVKRLLDHGQELGEDYAFHVGLRVGPGAPGVGRRPRPSASCIDSRRRKCSGPAGASRRQRRPCPSWPCARWINSIL